MDISSIRALRMAKPFHPFKLILKDGRSLFVDLPYRLAIATTRPEIAFASDTEGIIFVKAADVREAQNGQSVNG
jgi:hypothetical protein